MFTNGPYTKRGAHSRVAASLLGTGIDQPNRYELFLLGEGEKKVTFAPETRVPNAALFTFNKEDHTLGNLLRAQLNTSPHVLFAAYKTPHPLFAMFELRVQTDGEITPKEAVVQACQDIIQDLQKLDQEFTKEFELKKIAGGGGMDV
ncbi:DNA-directed RNA polymerase II core subunit [Taxawa tesnikishii (nom. ined.)]|nr:DNA-directed RNA polymerase II core subunit [Dothideales sp. JES 119]